MDDKVTIDLDRDTFDALSRQAQSHGNSVDQEASAIMRRVLGSKKRTMTADDSVRRAREIRAMTPKGAVQTDSTLMIREDRDRGHSIDRR